MRDATGSERETLPFWSVLVHVDCVLVHADSIERVRD